MLGKKHGTIQVSSVNIDKDHPETTKISGIDTCVYRFLLCVTDPSRLLSEKVHHWNYIAIAKYSWKWKCTPDYFFIETINVQVF